MRLAVAIMLFASLTAAYSFPQTSTVKAEASPIRTSICELAKDPQRFDGKQITIHARYFASWEWPTFFKDEACEENVSYLPPGAYFTPPQYANLRVDEDSAFRDFENKEKLLCNGMNDLCDFDFLEADFTGVFVAANRMPQSVPKDLSKLSGLVVTGVRGAVLHEKVPPTLLRADVEQSQCNAVRVTYKPYRLSASQFHIEKIQRTPMPSPYELTEAPQGSRWFSQTKPDTTKPGPWTTTILVGDRRGAYLKITFPNHSQYGVHAEWINDKLLYLQLWPGRIVSNDMILDVEKNALIYSESASYGEIVQPCR